MISHVYTTLYRDTRTLLQRGLFWLLLVFWALISALLFFAYFEDFLSIQPLLRAKQFRYGITDMVIIPYLKTLSYIAMIVVSALCSRLFYAEIFSPFASLYRGLRQPMSALIIAKLLYIGIISFVLLAVIALPVIGSGLFFELNIMRVWWALMALFVLLFSIGTLTMVFSQLFAQSVLATLVALVITLITELFAKLVVEPDELLPIIAFFSPITHINRMVSGEIHLSDGVYFVTLLALLISISIRQMRNTYLMLS